MLYYFNNIFKQLVYKFALIYENKILKTLNEVFTLRCRLADASFFAYLKDNHDRQICLGVKEW